MAIKIIFYLFLGIVLALMALPPVKYYYFQSGMRWFYIFMFSLLAAYLFTPLFKRIAIKFNILDKPNWRKIHQNATPLLGGVAVYIAFAISMLFNNIFLPKMGPLLIGSSLILLMGLVDDIHPLPALFKFFMQVIISLMVIIVGDLQMTLFYNFPWAPAINIPLTVIWLVGLTNAMNFFDGIDGQASIISIIISSFLGIIAFKSNQPALGWFSVALAGSCMGFLPHNFRFRKSAKLFLGDAGSTFLGFTLAGLALLGTWSNTSHFVSLTAPMLIFGVLIFDMIYVNTSRIKNRRAKNFFELLICVNKDHLHHRLLLMGFDRKEVVFIISVLNACLGVSALIIMKQNVLEAVLGLAQTAMILGLIVIFMLKGREKSIK